MPEHYYCFLGYHIGIQSNSEEVLSHLGSVYGRFYFGNSETTPDPQADKKEAERNFIQVIDKLSESSEIIIRDRFSSYCLKCKSLYAFDYEYYTATATVPDPMAYIQWVVLNNFCLLANDYQIIHAGAVSRNNEGVIFPATSGMGKTTLTLKLVETGFKFLSDELACLHPERMVVEPFFRKLNFNEQSRILLGIPPWPDTHLRINGENETEWAVDIEDVVPSSLSDACPLHYVIFLQGFGERPKLENMATSNALFKLFSYSLSLIKDRARLLYTFAPLMEQARCFNLVVGDLDETSEIVRQLIDENYKP